MKRAVLLASLLATPVVSAVSQTPESYKGGAHAAFDAVPQSLPVSLQGGNTQNLTCQAQVRSSSFGAGGRCMFNSVVTEVQLIGNVLQVRCGEIQVTCR